MKGVLSVLKGLFYGYAVYLPVMFAVEYVMYRRADTERTFYALYYPLGAPYLLFPSVRQYVQTDEVVLNLLGGALLVAGVVFALRRRRNTST